MKVVLISQSRSRVAPAVLAQRDAPVVGIVESAPRGHHSAAGSPGGILRQLRERFRKPRTLRELARRHRLPYFLSHRDNTPELMAWLKLRKVDLILVQSMSRLLPAEVLAIPAQGVLNLHPSLLPAYRGPNPSFWVIRNDEPESGVTLHFIDAGEDTGDLVYQERIPIPRGVRQPALLDHALGEAGSRMILKALRVLAAGQSLPRQPQSADSPTERARNVSRDEYPGLISWAEWSAERVWHFLRGTESFLATLLGSEDLRRGVRFTVGAYTTGEPPAAPGTLARDARGPFFACRNGTVRLERSFSVRHWLRG